MILSVADSATLLQINRTQLYWFANRGELQIQPPMVGSYGRYVTCEELRRFQLAKVARLEAELETARAVLVKIKSRSGSR